MEFTLWSIILALLTRSLFACHSFIAVWRLTDQKQDIRYWGCLIPLLLLVLETIYIIAQRKGKEYKWFSLCILLYLTCVVPSVWFLELERVDKYRDRLDGNVTSLVNSTNATCVQQAGVAEIQESLTEIQGLRIPLKLTSDAWLAVIEQTLIFLLVIGRWWLPTEKLSRDQLSQLLFVYLSMGSDMTELLVLFEEDYVLEDELIVYIILGVWSACLLQFTICFTAKRNNDATDKCCPSCKSELVIIFSSIFLQDAPFLGVRLYVIIKNETLSYTILFFALKNALVLLLQTYRFMIVMCCPDDRKQPQQEYQEYNLRYPQMGQYIPVMVPENPVAPNFQKVNPPKIKKRKTKAKSTNENYLQMPSAVNGLSMGLPNQGFPQQPIVMNTGMNMNPQFSPYHNYHNYGYQP